MATHLGSSCIDLKPTGEGANEALAKAPVPCFALAIHMKKMIWTVIASAFVLALGSVHGAEGDDGRRPTERQNVGKVLLTTNGTERISVKQFLELAKGFHAVAVGTNKVTYGIEGKGKHDIVLVHCWAGNMSFWNEQEQALTNKARLILIDLPGHGLSDKPHVAYTM